MEIYKPLLSGGVCRYARLGSFTHPVVMTLDVYAAIPVLVDTDETKNTGTVNEPTQYLLRHNVYQLASRALGNHEPDTVQNRWAFTVVSEETGLNIFVQSDTYPLHDGTTATGVFLCADARMIPRIDITVTTGEIAIHSMEHESAASIITTRGTSCVRPYLAT